MVNPNWPGTQVFTEVPGHQVTQVAGCSMSWEAVKLQTPKHQQGYVQSASSLQASFLITHLQTCFTHPGAIAIFFGAATTLVTSPEFLLGPDQGH